MTELRTTKLLRPYPNVAYIVLQENFTHQVDLEALKDVVEQAYRPYIEKNQQFILVFNTEYTSAASPFLIKDFASWMKGKSEVSSRLLLCSIMVITSKFTRMCFNAIIGVFTPSRPYILTDSVAAANKELAIKVKELNPS